MKRLGEAPQAAWQQAVDSCSYSTFFHTPAWARIVSKSFPRVRSTAQIFEVNGTRVLLPTTEYGAEAKGFFRAYFSNYLGVYGGPVADRVLTPKEFSALCAKFASIRTKRVDVVGNPYADVEPEVLAGWSKKLNFTQIVPLDTWSNEKELMSRYVHLVRNSVHRAERRGYTMKLAETAEEVRAYYELYKLALIRYADTATGRYPYELFLNALAEGPVNAPLWLVLHEGRIVGGVLSFVHKDRWIAWNAAFSEEEFPHGVAKYVHHKLILEAKGRGCRTYDFNPSGGHEGTVKFKEMYGTEKRYFWELSRNESPAFRAFRRVKREPDMSARPTRRFLSRPGSGALTCNVAHFRTPYLSITETFIYSVLKNLKAPIQPFVFTESVVNENLFPFPRIVDYSLRKGSPWRSLNGIFNFLFGNNVALLGSHFLRHDIKVIHAHFGPEACNLVRIANKLEIPIITTFYGFDMSSGPKKQGLHGKYQVLFEKGDVFLVEGAHMLKRLVDLGCPSAKIKIQRIGVDVDSVPFRERMPKSVGEKVVFLFCGRFIEKKGLIFAFQAFQRLIDQGIKNFEFRVIGDGPLMPEIKSYLDRHSVRDNTVMLGYRPHVEFLSELQRADILIAPSVTGLDGNSEGGAPTTILEAEAAGVPVISSLHADIPNVVLHGSSAMLSPERDVPALAENIRQMMDHPETWASFGRSGRAFVQANHNIATEVARLQEIYLALAKSRPAQG